VDILDTGIDVPEVVNLVFFKVVRSKTKFWQMLGRGTRLCPDLFGPGKDKENFFLFDYCGNLEFFSQNPATTDGSVADSLSKRLFKARVEMVGELDRQSTVGDKTPAWNGLLDRREPETDAEVRQAAAKRLHTEVTAMSTENVLIRPKRQWVEKYSRPEAWAYLGGESQSELAHEVAGLPSDLDPESEEAKRFDRLLLNLQLALLKHEPAFERLKGQVIEIAGLLEEKAAIPSVNAQMPLIQEIQSEAWWENVTLPMLESVRRRLRDLVKLIDKRKRKPVYTDFEDLMTDGILVELPGFAAEGSFEKFLAKVRSFLRAHQDHIAIHKLRMNKPLTATDLEELERMLSASGIGSEKMLARAKRESQGLGPFVRSLVGLEREAAKAALGGFLDGHAWSAQQIEFLNLVVNHLTQNGIMDAALLYESPFTDVIPQGPEGLFSPGEVDELVAVLDKVKAATRAA